VVRLISDRTSATVAVLTQLMDVLTAAAPGVSPEKAAADVRRAHGPPPARPGAAGVPAEPARTAPAEVGGMPAIIVAPILVGDEVPSYLITVDPADNLFGEDMSLLVTEHAATICGVIPAGSGWWPPPPAGSATTWWKACLLGRRPDHADASRWAAHLGYDRAGTTT